MTDQQKVLQALIEKPTRYTIDVQDNSMLPEKMKQKKTIDFVIKPPSPGTLMKCADLMQDLPEDFFQEGKKLDMREVLPHISILVKVICIMSHGKQDDYPNWYEPFLLSNTTGRDIYHIFQETAMKSQSGFFLTSFQIAGLSNPMMMKKYPKKKKNQTDSTPSGL